MNTVKGPDSQEERIEHMVALYQLPLLRMCIMYLHRFSKTSFQRVQKARNMVRAGLRAYLLLLWILPVFIAFLPVKISDFIHLLPRQFKIKYIEVLCDMIRIGGTVNGNVPILDLPAENDLRRGLSMSIGDLNDGFIGEMLLGMPSAAKGIPGFHHDPVLLYILLQRFVLIIQMVFVLDNGRHDLGKGQDFLHGLGV